jgi:hypothetical protein
MPQVSQDLTQVRFGISTLVCCIDAKLCLTFQLGYSRVAVYISRTTVRFTVRTPRDRETHLFSRAPLSDVDLRPRSVEMRTVNERARALHQVLDLDD